MSDHLKQLYPFRQGQDSSINNPLKIKHHNALRWAIATAYDEAYAKIYLAAYGGPFHPNNSGHKNQQERELYIKNSLDKYITEKWIR